jgi:hypothetical protein
LSLAADGLPWPAATAVGGWWNRAFQPEIDLIGADREPIATRIYYAGSIKWLNRVFDSSDLSALQRGAVAVPGFDPGASALIAVSRSGVSDTVGSQVALNWDAADIVQAFAG